MDSAGEFPLVCLRLLFDFDGFLVQTLFLSTVFEYLGIPYGLPIPKNGSSILTFQDGSPDNVFVTIIWGQVAKKAFSEISKSMNLMFFVVLNYF